MYYKHILTYNFSEDDTRASFMELVEGLGYMEAEDQSTYVLPFASISQASASTMSLPYPCQPLAK